MVKIAFLSNGCQSGLSRCREIIAADSEYREVTDPKKADVLMVNFCVISSEAINGFDKFRREVMQYKVANPKLKILAGGCVEGLTEKRDLSFADMVFPYQGEVRALATFLGKGQTPALAPAIMSGNARIGIAYGCNRRCSFCKVHFLNDRSLHSRPMEEIVEFARRALAQGIVAITLFAENSTEYGVDTGTNLQTLLEQLLALEGLRFLDVDGLCLDEVSPDLLNVLKHPKVRCLQLEAQSLDDRIRKNMHLYKTRDEVLEIFDALSDKFLVSNFMTGFPGHSIAEFNREMRQIRAHHLYFLILDPYDDTPGTPSHELYEPLDASTAACYRETFLRTVARERQLVLEKLLQRSDIEASVVWADYAKVQLMATHYTVQIWADQTQERYRPGDVVRVKITGLHPNVPDFFKPKMYDLTDAKKLRVKQNLQYLEYFDLCTQGQCMYVDGKIIDFG